MQIVLGRMGFDPDRVLDMSAAQVDQLLALKVELLEASGMRVRDAGVSASKRFVNRRAKR
jgi:hypothetical protein